MPSYFIEEFMGKSRTNKIRRDFGRNLIEDFHLNRLRVAERNQRVIAEASHRMLNEKSRLYRFVESESYLEDILAGDLWITTLNACRVADGRGRRDDGEGYLTHHVSSISSQHRGGREAIEQSGIVNLTSGAQNVAIRGLSVTDESMNAFVLCFTQRYAPDTMNEHFGGFCAQLNSPLAVFRMITYEISKHFSIARSIFGPVSYAGREFIDYELQTTHRALLKPHDQYFDQREIRMIWEVDSGHPAIESFKLRVPISAPYFSRKTS
jgi:hypothetical protein